MTITELEYFHFKLNFLTPFKNSKNTYNSREGFIIAVRNDKNIVGYGECSPLPGFSYESIFECEEQIQKLSVFLKNFKIDDDIHSIESFINKKNFFPSVKFGIEQCLLNILISGGSDFLRNNFRDANKEIDVNAVLPLNDKLGIISEIERKTNQGYKTFKLKIGNDFDSDFRLVESIRKYFGENLLIRLDVNGAWPKQEAIERIKQLSQLNIQYIEEPCGHLDSLIEIAKKSPVPIAVDESMNTPLDILNVIKSTNIEYIVLKPMIVSGIFSSLKLIEEAAKKKKKIIISSSFESSVGKSALAFLAAATGHKFAHGLDTSHLFKHDVSPDFYEVKNAKISFEPGLYPPKFNIVF